SWQEILLAYALPGVVWAVAFAFIVPRPEKPPEPELEQGAEDDWALMPPAPSADAPVRWSRLLTDPQMMLLCAQQFQRAAAAALFFTWFPRYLQEAKHVGVAESGGLAAWPLVA